MNEEELAAVFQRDARVRGQALRTFQDQVAELFLNFAHAVDARPFVIASRKLARQGRAWRAHLVNHPLHDHRAGGT